ncbi:MAG: hypothetical protein NZ908_03290, partial [Candidatus Micrarchaeota archaeon]|nr:hypothetical protein [Candidatus Micrarchaeota archaeon]
MDNQEEEKIKSLEEQKIELEEFQRDYLFNDARDPQEIYRWIADNWVKFIPPGESDRYMRMFYDYYQENAQFDSARGIIPGAVPLVSNTISDIMNNPNVPHELKSRILSFMMRNPLIDITSFDMLELPVSPVYEIDINELQEYLRDTLSELEGKDFRVINVTQQNHRIFAEIEMNEDGSKKKTTIEIDREKIFEYRRNKFLEQYLRNNSDLGDNDFRVVASEMN